MMVTRERIERAAAALGPEIGPLLIGLVQPVGVDEAQRLDAELELFLREMRAEAEERFYLDLPLIERLGDAGLAALTYWPCLSAQDRALLCAGLRYFILQEDAEGDLLSLVGFDDDAQVLNYVLEELRLPLPPVRIELPPTRLPLHRGAQVAIH